MSSAEITAYLAGIELARRSEVVKVSPYELPLDMTVDPQDPLYAAWRKLGTQAFKDWLVRGIGDAFSAGPAMS